MSAECQKCKKSFPDDELIPVQYSALSVKTTVKTVSVSTIDIQTPTCKEIYNELF